jgi:predicted acyltransferase
MQQRNTSLDALRGFAILAMILSGSIAFGNVLPAWMFHAQVPPPEHKFNPLLAGITWVDLVFPFFLFTMGAAIPLSLKKYITTNHGILTILKLAGKRFLLLVFFALFSNHLKAWVINAQSKAQHHLLSLLAFGLMFLQFYQLPSNSKGKKYFFWAKSLSFGFAIYLLYSLPFWNGKGFDFYKSDIIILVLANMAFFGTIIYFLTHNHPWLRVGILPFVLAIFLAAKEPDVGFAKTLFNFNEIAGYKIDWLYKFYFLKYLFIIIPGTLAGDWMLQNNYQLKTIQTNNKQLFISILSVTLLVINLVGLYNRWLLVNLIFSVLICYSIYYLSKNAPTTIKNFLLAGMYLLLLGLFFEAYEGGIKKDSSTYSYYFVTAGLAFYMLVIFTYWQEQFVLRYLVDYLSLNGKNPMLAYVVGSLLILPIMQLTHLKSFWDSMHQNAIMGFLKGVVFTLAVSGVTIFSVKKNWFWKT